ncbi:MAG: YbaK/EbsC family protein [Anaerolineales bacterium]|jgi:prolyl-tRNA editing enzyme YbaK/EbsC (Cys-tRNA(Pro) deacylase)
MNDLKLTPADLIEFMKQNAVPGEILHLSVPTPTVETAAQAVKTTPERIVKSILFLVDQNPVLAISCGLAHVDRRAIAHRYQVSRKRVKLAGPEPVLHITGYDVGALPPFGHLVPLPTLLDQRVLEHPFVYAGGGAENALVRLNPQDILRVSRAQVIDLQQSLPSDTNDRIAGQHPDEPLID